MALVLDFEPKELAYVGQQKQADATFSVVELDGERFFQIDTYGSSDRQLVGKRSQSLRLSRDAASKLVRLLQTEFSL